MSDEKHAPPTSLEVARKILDNKGDPLASGDPRIVQVLRLVVNELEEIRHDMKKPHKTGFELYGPRPRPYGPIPIPRLDGGKTFEEELKAREEEEKFHAESASQAEERRSAEPVAGPWRVGVPLSPAPRIPLQLIPVCPDCGDKVVNEVDVIELGLSLTKENWLCRLCFDHLVMNSRPRSDNKAALDILTTFTKSSRVERSCKGSKMSEQCKELAAHRKSRAIELLKKGVNPNRVARAVGVSWDSAKRWKDKLDKGDIP